MVTLVTADEVREVEVESEIGEVETNHWHYYVPCAGVRFYTFEPILSRLAELDPWAIDELTSRT